MTRNPNTPDLKQQAPVDPTLLVHDFHLTYGHPVAPAPAPTNDERTRLRLSLIVEEFFELLEASSSNPVAKKRIEALRREVEHFLSVPAAVVYGDLKPDLVETADALADLIYVIYGYALELGIPLSRILEEVHDSNMSKLDPETNLPIYRKDGKVLKGSNFREPDISGILNYTGTDR